MKLPHVLMVVLSGIVVALAWVLAEQAKGDFALPAQVVAALATALKIIDTVLGLATDSVQTSLAQKRALRAAASRVAMAFALVCLVVLGAIGCQGCAAVNPNVVGPSVNLGVCVISTVATDVAAGKPWSVCVSDAVTNCGADAASVVTIWDAHVAAEVKEGIVPKPIPGYPTADAGSK